MVGTPFNRPLPPYANRPRFIPCRRIAGAHRSPRAFRRVADEALAVPTNQTAPQMPTVETEISPPNETFGFGRELFNS